MVDGTVARKTKSDDEFGVRFDTFADCIFTFVSLIKFLPLLKIPNWLWIWTVVIAIIKIGNVILGCIHTKKLIFLHTIMNKATGVVLFLLPLTLRFVELKYSSIVVCLIATLSAIQEGYYIRTNNEII